MSDRKDGDGMDEALRDALAGIPRPVPSAHFTARVVARLAAAPEPPRRRTRAAAMVLLAYGAAAIAVSLAILARLPAPLFAPEAARALALDGALASPLLLLGPVRRFLLLLVGRC